MSKLNLFETKQKCNCNRCDAPCKVDPVDGSKATMLKRGKDPKGLCVNCAAHEVLRNLYPVNMLLARSGPKGLALAHIQNQFEGIINSVGTDAAPGEIDWSIVIENWDLPFPNKIKRSAMNPMNDEDLAREPERHKKQMEMLKNQLDDPRTPEQRMEDVKKEFIQKIIPLLRAEK